MTNKYCVNKDADENGYHEVHNDTCYLWPIKNCIDLGSHSNCQDAVKEAKKYYDKMDDCWFCSRNCHTR